jgi:hypothetical protein
MSTPDKQRPRQDIEGKTGTSAHHLFGSDLPWTCELNSSSIMGYLEPNR